MKGMYIYFKDLPVKSEFMVNGTNYIKQSSKTLRLVNGSMRWFYAAQLELCVVGSYCHVYQK